MHVYVYMFVCLCARMYVDECKFVCVRERAREPCGERKRERVCNTDNTYFLKQVVCCMCSVCVRVFCNNLCSVFVFVHVYVWSICIHSHVSPL